MRGGRASGREPQKRLEGHKDAPGEGLESVAGALEELGVSPGEELSSSPKREKRHLALPTPRLKIWL